MMKYIILAGLITAAAQADVQLNENLLENSGFETDTGWDGTLYRSVDRTYETVGFTGDAAPYSGDYMFYGGDDSEYASVSQTISLTGIDTAAQASGAYSVEWGGCLSSWDSSDYEYDDTDFSSLTLEQLDSEGSVISSSTLGDEDANTWQLMETTTALDADTASLRFTVSATRERGSDNNGYADDVFMAVVPEPSTLSLIALCGGAVFAIRKKFTI